MRDRLFKALSDPVRRSALLALRSGPLSAGELADQLGISPNALSFHTRILKDANLVRVDRQGRHKLYTLNTSVLEQFIVSLSDAFAGAAHTRTTAKRRRKA